eukprot:CAMPEP_0178779538 /NCGR_PEP_ID=MMETSP0745-20121128/1577_1 /TAXON_ID=913974 /ORGANISM="Nitzschia punctata, Strain CCMP561" /LENGTH=56 /DNA_ID=CAMNT_0020436733 /DNA_START=180 /DNA_END=350 /DNA_ORIENTATION=-
MIEANANCPFPIMIPSPALVSPLIPWKAITTMIGKIAAFRTVSNGVERKIAGAKIA